MIGTECYRCGTEVSNLNELVTIFNDRGGVGQCCIGCATESEKITAGIKKKPLKNYKQTRKTLEKQIKDIDDILEEVNEHGYEDDLTDILDDIRFVIEHGRRPGVE